MPVLNGIPLWQQIRQQVIGETDFPELNIPDLSLPGDSWAIPQEEAMTLTWLYGADFSKNDTYDQFGLYSLARPFQVKYKGQKYRFATILGTNHLARPARFCDDKQKSGRWRATTQEIDPCDYEIYTNLCITDLPECWQLITTGNNAADIENTPLGKMLVKNLIKDIASSKLNSYFRIIQMANHPLLKFVDDNNMGSIPKFEGGVWEDFAAQMINNTECLGVLTTIDNNVEEGIKGYETDVDVICNVSSDCGDDDYKQWPKIWCAFEKWIEGIGRGWLIDEAQGGNAGIWLSRNLFELLRNFLLHENRFNPAYADQLQKGVGIGKDFLLYKGLVFILDRQRAALDRYSGFNTSQIYISLLGNFGVISDFVGNAQNDTAISVYKDPNPAKSHLMEFYSHFSAGTKEYDPEFGALWTCVDDKGQLTS